DVSLRIVPLVMTMRNLVGDVVDAVVSGGAADLIHAVQGEPSRAGEQRDRQAVIADRCAQLGDSEWTLLVLRQVFLAGPDDLHGLAELPGYLGRLTCDACATSSVSTETAAQEHGVRIDCLRIDPELVGNQADCR